MANIDIKNWNAYQGVFNPNGSVKIPVVVVKGEISIGGDAVGGTTQYVGSTVVFDPVVSNQFDGIVSLASVVSLGSDVLVTTFNTNIDYSKDISSLSCTSIVLSDYEKPYTIPAIEFGSDNSYFGSDYAMGNRNDFGVFYNNITYNYRYIPLVILYNTLNNKYLYIGYEYPISRTNVNNINPFFSIYTQYAVHTQKDNAYYVAIDSLSIFRFPTNTLVGVYHGSKLDSLLENRLTYHEVKQDPYSGGGTSGAGGGTGSFDGTGDAISAPSVPTLGATTTGFVSLYNPTLSQVQELASYMWSDAFSIDSFKKLFADPMDTILGLSIVPVAVPDGATTELKVGNLSTGISITRAGAQYITVDCGSIAVNEYWGAYLDYAPYTKLEIYLPYIGTHQLSADDVMGKTISVKYNVDILSGSCVAFITCGDSVLYTFSGQCAQNIPITGEDFTSNLMGAISLAASVGAVVASGGGAAAVMPAAAGLTSSYINAFKPDIQRSGNIGGTSGMLGIQVPYLILTRPRQCTPENQNKYLGYPSFITEDLSELSGYTEIEDIQLEGCTATDTEIDEIKSLLAGGVLL